MDSIKGLRISFTEDSQHFYFGQVQSSYSNRWLKQTLCCTDLGEVFANCWGHHDFSQNVPPPPCSQSTHFDVYVNSTSRLLTDSGKSCSLANENLPDDHGIRCSDSHNLEICFHIAEQFQMARSSKSRLVVWYHRMHFSDWNFGEEASNGFRALTICSIFYFLFSLISATTLRCKRYYTY